jgi:hypothetical protein
VYEHRYSDDQTVYQEYREHTIVQPDTNKIAIGVSITCLVCDMTVRLHRLMNAIGRIQMSIR